MAGIGKQGRDDSIKHFCVQAPYIYIFSLCDYGKRSVGGGLYTELFHAIIFDLFCFCHSARSIFTLYILRVHTLTPTEQGGKGPRVQWPGGQVYNREGFTVLKPSLWSLHGNSTFPWSGMSV